MRLKAQINRAAGVKTALPDRSSGRREGRLGEIPSNLDHQEGQHRADSGAPPAWAWPAR